ncbi:MAG: RagB/SusD family nutrient uptake outer membrane protein [Bacteroidota bacterium]|nr:RagB/SusD family nutrient uptake outer membrane protein [Bacteroidota bacterium]
MKTFQKILVLSILISTFACGPEFLEEPVRNQSPEDFANNGNPSEIVTAVYNNLYTWEQHSFSWIGISSITSDDADKGSVASDLGTDKQDLDNWTFTPSSISFNDVWTANFRGIARANQALKYLPGFTTIAAPLKSRFIAEVKFLRAYYYFNLVRMFGGVPKLEKVPVTPEEIENANVRATAEEIYLLIETDLNEAAAILPSFYSSSDFGRPTRWSAKGLLAKVSLYQKKWSSVLFNCDEIIQSNQFALLQDYSKIWRESGEFSSESIWEINAKGDDPSKGIQQYNEVQGPRGGANDRGWGFNVPTENLIQAYEPGDKRKEATILGVPQITWDGSYSTEGTVGPYYNYKAYVSRTHESWSGNNSQTNKNLRILRYGEILLMKAEAENELSHIPEALSALNLVRNRAGLRDTSAQDQNSIRNLIWNERRLELAFEHDRTFDLRRQGRAGDVLRSHRKNYIDIKHDLFPIPQIQVDLSNGKLIQNPLY